MDKIHMLDSTNSQAITKFEKSRIEGRENTDDTKLECYGTRHTLALMGFLGSVCLYAMRGNMAVAIVAMAKHTQTDNVRKNSTSDGCLIPEDYYETSNTQMGEFDWDEETQGLILSAFFYGNVLTNVLGGRAAEFFGGRIVAGIGILSTSILALVCPFAARSSYGLLVLVRVLQGCSDGVSFPAIALLIANWYPANERSKFTTFIFSGVLVGTILTLPISGWLCSAEFSGGWPSVFYVFGAAGLIWGIFWFWLIKDDPRQKEGISDAELKYILNGCPQHKDRLSVPWISILKSKVFWALGIAHFGDSWGLVTFITDLPTYLDKILHFNIRNNGMLSSLPHLASLVFGNIFSLATNWLIARGRLCLITLRKLSMGLFFYGSIIGLIALCFVDCQPILAIIMIILCRSFAGCVYAGYLSSYADISPRFAGTLAGLTNTIACIPGFIAPAVVGALTQDNQTQMAWKIVFLITAAIYGFCGTFFMVFITTKIQDWNDPNK